MFGVKTVSTASIARRMVSCSNNRFRSFVSVDNLLQQSNTNEPSNNQGQRSKRNPFNYKFGRSQSSYYRIPTASSSFSSYSYNDTNNVLSSNLTTKRNFSTSSPLNEATNNSSSSGYISPEEAMKQFEDKANAAEVTTATTSEVATNVNNGWEATWWPQDQMVSFFLCVYTI